MQRAPPVRRRYTSGETPLHKAAGGGYENIVELLIASGADANAKNAYGETPLHEAAVGGHKSIAELLIANGADANAKRRHYTKRLIEVARIQ